jgi:hypothetical protein
MENAESPELQQKQAATERGSPPVASGNKDRQFSDGYEKFVYMSSTADVMKDVTVSKSEIFGLSLEQFVPDGYVQFDDLFRNGLCKRKSISSGRRQCHSRNWSRLNSGHTFERCQNIPLDNPHPTQHL